MISAAPKPLACTSCDGRLEADGLCLVCLLNAGLEAEHESSATRLPAVVRTLTLPCDFAGYRLVREIASGGMGIIYEAQDVKLKRVVALKVIRNAIFATREEAARFKAETQAVAQLDHPDIMPIYESGEAGGMPYYTMRLAEGGSLADRLRKRGPIPDREAAALMSRIARAVQHAHDHGVLHRDVKPANILLDVGGRPLLSDFGLAKLLDAEFQFTRSQAHVGTPHHMSPEQAAGRAKQITTASDVWALGVMLYQMLTNQLPFQGGSALEVMRRITEEAPDISSTGRLITRTSTPSKSAELAAGQIACVQRDLATLILRCLEKQPARRLPGAGFLADELDRFLSGEPIQSRAVGNWERLRKLALRNKAATLAVVGTSLSLIVGAAVSVWQAVEARKAQVAAEQGKIESDEIASIILQTVHGLDEYLVGRNVDPEQMRGELLRRVSEFHGDPRRKAAMLEELSTLLNQPDDLQLYRQALAEVTPHLATDDPLLWSMRYRVALKTLHLADPSGPAALAAREELRGIIAWQTTHLPPADGSLDKTKYALAEDLVHEVKSQAALQEAETLLRSCIADYEKKGDWFDIVVGRIELMTAIFGQGRQEEALKLGRETCLQSLKENGVHHSITGRIYGRLARHCREAGLTEESIECGRKALDIYWHTVGPDDAHAQHSLNALSATLVKSGDLSANLALQRAAVKACDLQLGAVHPCTLQRVEILLATLRQMSRLKEARKDGSLWLNRVRLVEDSLPPAATGLLIQQSLTLLDMQQPAQADALLQELPLLIGKTTDDSKSFARFVPLASALLDHHRPQMAGTILQRVITFFEQHQGEDRKQAASVLLQAKQKLEQAGQAMTSDEFFSTVR